MSKHVIDRMKRSLGFANNNWFVLVLGLVLAFGLVGTAVAGNYIPLIETDWLPDWAQLRRYNETAQGSKISPFSLFESSAIVAVGLGVFAFCRFRGARPCPPAVHLTADPLQEALDGAHRIYVDH